ncbi:MAG: hypothetical protein M3N32_07985 [Actinomycetota bacterium]|nr:hypothetical protein [Actinomycetota bacterium]
MTDLDAVLRRLDRLEAQYLDPIVEWQVAMSERLDAIERLLDGGDRDPA